MYRLYIHPLPVRIWHWTNAVGFVLMILTGMQIRYVGLIDVVTFRTAVRVHLQVEVGHDQELHLGVNLTCGSAISRRPVPGQLGM